MATGQSYLYFFKLPVFLEPSLPGTKLTVIEKVNSSNIFTILGLDEEFQETLGDLELEISNKEQNGPFYLTKENDTIDGTSSWNLGVSGEPRLTELVKL